MSRRTFVQRWQEAVLDSDLSPSEKLVALVLGNFADFPTGANARPGAEKLSAKTGYSVRTIYRLRDQLVEKGWIKVTFQGGSFKGKTRSASCYQLAFPTSDPCRGVSGQSGNSDARPLTQSHLTPDTGSYHHYRPVTAHDTDAPSGAVVGACPTCKDKPGEAFSHGRCPDCKAEAA